MTQGQFLLSWLSFSLSPYLCASFHKWIIQKTPPPPPLSYLPNPSTRAGYDTGSIFKRSLTGLNSEFSFSYTSCLTKPEEPSLSYYLPIAGGRIIGFIPFPRVLVLCEMQLVSARIWTRVAVSISYDDNHYTTGTSRFLILTNHRLFLYIYNCSVGLVCWIHWLHFCGAVRLQQWVS